MAERRGGYQRPSDRASTAPRVGRSSRRTDRQLIATPNVQEGTDLQQGDRERIRQMQRARPLGQTPSPNVPPPARGSTSSAARGGGLDLGALLGRPTNRPGEEITEGLPFGPGGGSEVLSRPEPVTEQEIVLSFLAYHPEIQDESARQMLDDIRAEREMPDVEPGLQEEAVPEVVLSAEEEEVPVEEGDEFTSELPLPEVAVEEEGEVPSEEVATEEGTVPSQT